MLLFGGRSFSAIKSLKTHGPEVDTRPGDCWESNEMDDLSVKQQSPFSVFNLKVILLW
jgi:hypothetical protein